MIKIPQAAQLPRDAGDKPRDVATSIVRVSILGAFLILSGKVQWFVAV